MKKALLFFYLVIFTNFLFAQEYSEYHDILVCKNPNGVVETLKIGATKVYYFSTVYPKEVELKVKQTLNSMFVSFPNETKIYELRYSGMGILECTNPDGSKQTFLSDGETYQNLGTYKTKAKNGVFEFLDFRRDKKYTENLSVYYWTSTNTKKIVLSSAKMSVEPKCLGGYISCDIQFPNDKTIYKIAFEIEQEKPFIRYLICTNTKDNTIQRFDWIRK